MFPRLRLGKKTNLDASRERLQTDGVLKKSGSPLTFAAEYKFQTPSVAAALILGTAANGRSSWEDAAGKTLDEHFRKDNNNEV